MCAQLCPAVPSAMHQGAGPAFRAMKSRQSHVNLTAAASRRPTRQQYINSASDRNTTSTVACAAGGDGGSSGRSGRGGGGGSGGNGNGGSEGAGGADGRSHRHLPVMAVLSVLAVDLCCAKEAEAEQLDSTRLSGQSQLLSTAIVSLGLPPLPAAVAQAYTEPERELSPCRPSTPDPLGAHRAAEPLASPAGSSSSPTCSSTSASSSDAQHPSTSGSTSGSTPCTSTAKPAATMQRIVLFIEPSPFTYTSGYQTRFQATIKEMVRAGCKVMVVTPGRGAAGLLPGGAPQPTEWCGARIVEAGSFPCPGYSSVPLSLGLSPRIYNEVRNWQPDVIHVTSPGALPVAAWLYSRLLRVPLVASFHTHVPTYLPKLGLGWLVSGTWGLIRAIHRAAHLTIAVSPKAANDLIEAGACDSGSVKVWRKAADCETFHPDHASPAMRRRLAGDGSEEGDGPLLLYVGRVSHEKNVELLKPVLQRVPGARLAIVGDGPAMKEMQAHFAGTRTRFLGFLKGQQLAAAYASADIFVMPSESETLGNVVGEAMASGLPVVAAAAGGVPSVIARPGETGILFPPGDAEAAASAIHQLMRDPDYRRRMSRAARAEMERWSWRQATLEILQDHYPAAAALAAA